MGRVVRWRSLFFGESPSFPKKMPPKETASNLIIKDYITETFTSKVFCMGDRPLHRIIHPPTSRTIPMHPLRIQGILTPTLGT